MTKKAAISILLIACALICALCCACVKNTSEEEEVTLSSVTVVDSTVPSDAVKGSVDVTQIQIELTYSDGRTERMTIDESMLTADSLQKLSQVGTHLLTVVYKNKVAKFQMEIHDLESVYYSLTIYGGVPTYINNVKIVNPIKVVGDYYRATYLEGTVVTVEWIDDGNNFSYWMANDLQVSTDSIVNVTVDSNLTYRAYSAPSVCTVSFKTFCDAKLESKTTNSLSESDITAIFKDNYIFNGWTTDEITEAQSLSAYGKNKVKFPYTVGRDITFYATWIPMGIVYTKVDDHYEVTGYEGVAASLEIPSKYLGLDVTEIRRGAFDKTKNPEGLEKLRVLTIPETMTVIEEGAFVDCAHLESFGVSDESIAQTSPQFKSVDDVLYSADGKSIVAYPANKLCATYEIENTCEDVYGYAFFNAVVGAVKLSAKTMSIGTHAFDSVHIDHVDFSLVNPIPGFSIEDNVFSDYINTVVTASSNKERLLNFSAEMASMDKKVVTSLDSAHKVYLYSYQEGDDQPTGVLYRVIYDKNLVSADSVTSDRESYATAEIIGLYRETTMFAVPIRLIPQEKEYYVTSLADYAFKNCTKLATLVISPSSMLERIGEEVFTDTPWLKTVGDTIYVNNIIYKYLGSDEIFYADEELQKIAEGAFRNNKTLKYVDVSSGAALTTIAPYAFENCTSLVGFICEANPQGDGIYLKYAVRFIGEYAFYNTAITAVKLQPSSLKQSNYLAHIGEYAFAECKRLLSVTISRSTTDIAATAFIRCISLQEFILADTTKKNDVFEVYDGILYKYDKSGGYTVYCYPAGRVDGEFDPVNVRLYGFAFEYSLEDYTGSSEVAIGSMLFSGEYKSVFLTICVDEPWIKEYDVLRERYVLKTQSGRELTPCTSITAKKDGTFITNGDFYYSIFEDEVRIPLLYDEEKEGYYYYPQKERYVTFDMFNLTLYTVSGAENIGTVSLSGKSYTLYIKVKDGFEVVAGNDTVPVNKADGQKLRQTTSVFYSADGTFSDDDVDGDFYYYIELTAGQKTVLLYDAARGQYYFKAGINVVAIAPYAFSYSSVAAVRIPSVVGSIGNNAFTIPGLQYIRFDGNPAFFDYSTVISEYEPECIYISNPGISDNDKLSFFGNDYDLRDRMLNVKRYTYAYDDRYNDVLYAFRREGDNVYVSVVRTSRIKSTIELPEVLVVDGEAYTQNRTVAPYAFYSAYLVSVTLRSVGTLASHAFSDAYAMTALYVQTSSFISDVQTDTFNPELFHNGLYIYDTKNSINLYRESNWVPAGALFTYKDAEGEDYSACRYLILDENKKPFAVITYKNELNQIKTVDVIHDKITQEDVRKMQSDIARAGYDIIGWEDEFGNEISGSEDYYIPFNQVLSCRWAPQTYRVYFVVSEGEVRKVENGVNVALPASTNQTTKQTTYVSDVTYDADYAFIYYNYDENSKVFLYWKNTENTLTTFLTSGVWQTAIESRTIYLAPVLQERWFTLNYVVDNSLDPGGDPVVTLPRTSDQVRYRASGYMLAVPTNDVYLFRGWYMLADETLEDVPSNRIYLTDENGKAKLDWLYSDKSEYTLYALWDAVIIYPYDIAISSTKINYNENFTLAIPEDESFTGWYVEIEDEAGNITEVMITDKNGNSLGPWLYEGMREYLVYKK